MKTCLLCKNKEPGLIKTSPDVFYICSGCVQDLIRMPKDDLAEKYTTAVEKGNYGLAYALSSFVPRRLRVQFPYNRPKSNKPLHTVARAT